MLLPKLRLLPVAKSVPDIKGLAMWQPQAPSSELPRPLHPTADYQPRKLLLVPWYSKNAPAVCAMSQLPPLPTASLPLCLAPAADADTLALLTEKTRQAKEAQKVATAAEERITALLLEQSAQEAALGEAQRALRTLGGQLPDAVPPAAAAYEGGLEEAKGRLGELRGQLAASQAFLQRAAVLEASSGAGSMEAVVAQLRLAAQRPATAAPTAEAAAAAVAAAVQSAAGRGEGGTAGVAAAAGAQGAAEGAEGGQEEEEEEGDGEGVGTEMTAVGQEPALGYQGPPTGLAPGQQQGPVGDTVSQCEAALGALRQLRAAAEAAVAAGALPVLSGLAGRLGEEVAETKLKGEALEREIEALQVVVM